MTLAILILAACAPLDSDGARDLYADPESGVPDAPGIFVDPEQLPHQSKTPGDEASEPVSRGVPGPLVGGTLVTDGQIAYASDPLGDEVHAFGTTAREWQRARRWTATLPAGDRPGRLALDGDRLFVVAMDGDALVALDAATGAIRWRAPSCDGPQGVDTDVSGDVWVSCADGTLARHSASDGVIVDQYLLREHLGDVVATGGKVFVAVFRSADLLVLDRDGLTRLRPPSADIVTARNGRTSPYASRAARRLVEHPYGGVAMLHQRNRDDVVTPPDEGPLPPAYYGPPSDIRCADISHAAITWFAGNGAVLATGPLEGVQGATDLAIDPRTGDYFVSTRAAPGLPDVYRFRHGGSPVPDSECRPFVERFHSNGPDRTGLALLPGTDDDTAARLVGVSEHPFALHRGRLEPAVIDEAIDPGWARFYEITPTGVSCETCHPSGLEDGHVWEFLGNPPRRTQVLAIGGLMQTSPFHWSGDRADIGALLHDVYTVRMDGGILTRTDEVAFAAWLDRLPAPPPLARDLDQVARGREVFDRADMACGTCHAGALLTDNRTHNVGSGGRFQTPSLVGLGARSQLFHDGCAAETVDALGACGGEPHDVADVIGEDEARDLVAYLQTL